MFIDKLQAKYEPNEPIFINEILDEFSEYSRGYVFKLIKKAEEKDELVNFSTGVYFIPTKTILGLSTITTEDVVEKKYISSKNETFGIYSGLQLQNMFNLTTQMTNTIEVVTNNESMRKRKIEINGRRVILRKSKVNITKDNVNEYMLLQLMTEIGSNINEISRERIKKFINRRNIDYKIIIKLASHFPSKAIKNLIISGVLDNHIF